MKPIILYGPDGRELQTGVILGFHEPAKRRREDSRPEVDAIGYATVWPDEELEAIENRAASRD